MFKKNSFIKGNTQSHNKEKYYYPTGLIQCLWANKLDKMNSAFDKSYAMIFDNIESFDINDLKDFKIAEKYKKL